MNVEAKYKTTANSNASDDAQLPRRSGLYVASKNVHERRHVPGNVRPYLVRELKVQLTPAEYSVWDSLILHSNRESYCCLLHETICRETGLASNTAHAAKRGLIEKKWVTCDGQREGRGANIYKIQIPLPSPVAAFLDQLWELLNREAWWNKDIGSDRFKYTDGHLDWLIAWRVIGVLKETDREQNKDEACWTPFRFNERATKRTERVVAREIPECLAVMATHNLMARLRRAAPSLNPERGLWWLWGDGFDEAK